MASYITAHIQLILSTLPKKVPSKQFPSIAQFIIAHVGKLHLEEIYKEVTAYQISLYSKADVWGEIDGILVKNKYLDLVSTILAASFIQKELDQPSLKSQQEIALSHLKDFLYFTDFPVVYIQTYQVRDTRLKPYIENLKLSVSGSIEKIYKAFSKNATLVTLPAKEFCVLLQFLYTKAAIPKISWIALLHKWFETVGISGNLLQEQQSLSIAFQVEVENLSAKDQTVGHSVQRGIDFQEFVIDQSLEFLIKEINFSLPEVTRVDLVQAFRNDDYARRRLLYRLEKETKFLKWQDDRNVVTKFEGCFFIWDKMRKMDQLGQTPFTQLWLWLWASKAAQRERFVQFLETLEEKTKEIQKETMKAAMSAPYEFEKSPRVEMAIRLINCFFRHDRPDTTTTFRYFDWSKWLSSIHSSYLHTLNDTDSLLIFCHFLESNNFSKKVPDSQKTVTLVKKMVSCLEVRKLEQTALSIAKCLNCAVRVISNPNLDLFFQRLGFLILPQELLCSSFDGFHIHYTNGLEEKIQEFERKLSIEITGNPFAYFCIYLRRHLAAPNQVQLIHKELAQLEEYGLTPCQIALLALMYATELESKQKYAGTNTCKKITLLIGVLSLVRPYFITKIPQDDLFELCLQRPNIDKEELKKLGNIGEARKKAEECMTRFSYPWQVVQSLVDVVSAPLSLFRDGKMTSTDSMTKPAPLSCNFLGFLTNCLNYLIFNQSFNIVDFFRLDPTFNEFSKSELQTKMNEDYPDALNGISLVFGEISQSTGFAISVRWIVSKSTTHPTFHWEGIDIATMRTKVMEVPLAIEIKNFKENTELLPIIGRLAEKLTQESLPNNQTEILKPPTTILEIKKWLKIHYSDCLCQWEEFDPNDSLTHLLPPIMEFIVQLKIQLRSALFYLNEAPKEILDIKMQAKLGHIFRRTNGLMSLIPPNLSLPPFITKPYELSVIEVESIQAKKEPFVCLTIKGQVEKKSISIETKLKEGSIMVKLWIDTFPEAEISIKYPPEFSKNKELFDQLILRQALLVKSRFYCLVHEE